MTPFLKGTVALVTGASDGLGAATATLLARAGARVVGMARRAEPLAAMRARIEAEGGQALAVPGDICDAGDVARAVDEAVAAFGRIDFLINIAGTVEGVGHPVWETDHDTWDRVWRINATGPLNLVRAVTPVMTRQRSGRMLFLCSPAVVAPVARTGAYAASKAAVNQLALTLAQEVRTSGISVNSFNPGPIDTPSYARVWTAMTPPGSARMPGQAPEAAASLLLWLCAPETEGLTGQFVHWSTPMTRTAVSRFVSQRQVGAPTEVA